MQQQKIVITNANNSSYSSAMEGQKAERNRLIQLSDEEYEDPRWKDRD